MDMMVCDDGPSPPAYGAYAYAEAALPPPHPAKRRRSNSDNENMGAGVGAPNAAAEDAVGSGLKRLRIRAPFGHDAAAARAARTASPLFPASFANPRGAATAAAAAAAAPQTQTTPLGGAASPPLPPEPRLGGAVPADYGDVNAVLRQLHLQRRLRQLQNEAARRQHC